MAFSKLPEIGAQGWIGTYDNKDSKRDDDRMSQQFSKDMQNEFEMSLLGELNFFLGIQISQLDDGIFYFPIQVYQRNVE